MKSKYALLIIDVQAGLFNKSMKVYNSESLLNNINQLIDFFHCNKDMVIFIRHTNENILAKGTQNWNIHHDLHFMESDIVVDKRKSNVFDEKNLIPILEKKSIEKVVIVGLVTHGCVQAACYGARQNGLEVILIGDAHSSFNKKAEELILEWNKKISLEEGMSVLSTEDFCCNG